jgi:RND family efflux transporter MFP subunit
VARKIVEHNEYTGRMAAIENVLVRPRVSGYITQISFKEGSIVKKDDLLFVIDPRPYQAALDEAAGQLKQAQAQQELSDRDFVRAQTLQATKVSSKEEFDQAATARNQSAAQVATAQANVNAANLNLEFTQIRSPIDGRISRQDVTVGNLVTSDSTVLTNIVSVDPIYAYADVDERTVLAYQKLITEGKVKSARDSRVAVAIAVAGEQGFPHHGYIDFVDNQINAATGTLAVRGQFPNPDGNLLPGMFVRMQIPVSGEIDALLITDRAVGSDQGQKFVYVLNGDKTERRPVTLGPVVDGLRVVAGGLKPDDQVVIEGLMKVRPGAQVKAEQGNMEQFASTQLEIKPLIAAPRRVPPGK